MMARVLALLALFHSAAAEASCVHVQNHAYGKECAAWADGMYYKTTEMQDGKPIWQRGHGHVPEWGDMVRRPLPARRACAAPSRLLRELGLLQLSQQACCSVRRGSEGRRRCTG